MKQERVIEWAHKAHGPLTGKWWDMDAAALARFAEFVEQATLERAAQTGMMVATNGIEVSAAIRNLAKESQ